MQNDLIIEIEKGTNETIVSLQGEVDIFSADDFKKKIYELIETNETNFIFNCEKLSYIDSTGLGVFVSFLKKSKQHGFKIKLIRVRANILKLFVITGLDRIMDIEKGVL